MSREGRRRLVLGIVRITTATTVVAGVLWSGWQISRLVGQKTTISTPAPGELVKSIQLETDGALNKAWVQATLNLPKNATLLGLNLEQLRERLLADGQVSHAKLELQLPSTLFVRTWERSPVARVRIETNGQAQVLLVARDGVVFPGAGYEPDMLESLPWLDGVDLVRTSKGFRPIEGMARVAELLAKAKLEAEHLYKNWHSVSMAALESDGVIEVQTKNDAQRVLFSTGQDYFRQLSRLDWTLDHAPVRRIDLTDPDRIPVVLAAPEATTDARPASVVPAPPRAVGNNLPLNFKF